MKKFLLKLLMGASLTTSVFIFQACYGVPPTVEVPRNQTESQVSVTDEPAVENEAEAVEEEEVTDETLD